MKRRERAPGGRAHVFYYYYYRISLYYIIIKWSVSKDAMDGEVVTMHVLQYLYYTFLTYYGASRSGHICCMMMECHEVLLLYD